VGKHVTSAKYRKTCKASHVWENMQPVVSKENMYDESCGKTFNQCQA